MSSEASEELQETEIVYIASVVESLEDPPMDDWSSLEIEISKENIKKVLHKQGLYHPESEELCTKYLSMSASSVLRHPYYNYPAVLDPGIKEALLEPQNEIIYLNDGQQLYLAVCKEMGQCPVRSFYKGLLTDSINLKYYGVNPLGVRAMATALQYNRNVTVLDLTDNHLNDDACFHLGEMLMKNYILKELNLSGCKIGVTGAKQLFAGLPPNRGIRVLNLSRNDLGDSGIEHLATTVNYGITVEELYLSRNNITGKSLGVLADAVEVFNKFTVLDLSLNSINSPLSGTIHLLNCLSENKVVQELNLSWNSLSGERIGVALALVLKCPKLRCINLSYNKIMGQAIENIIGSLGKAKSLITLNLSHNPLTPEDAINVVQKLQRKTVKVKNVLMDGVNVTTQFLILLKEVKAMEQRLNTVITYGEIINSVLCKGPDIRDLVLNRAEYLTKRVKKNKIDIALWAMQLLKDQNPVIPAKMFADMVTQDGVPLDGDLVDGIVNAFPGSKDAKEKTINIESLVDYINRKWPDRKLPPTPPPEIETIVTPKPIQVPQKPTKRK